MFGHSQEDWFLPCLRVAVHLHVGASLGNQTKKPCAGSVVADGGQRSALRISDEIADIEEEGMLILRPHVAIMQRCIRVGRTQNTP